MGKPARDSEPSVEERRHELRSLAKEIESVLSEAKFGKSVHAYRLLEEAPASYGIGTDLIEAVANLKGERHHRLEEALYDLFAKAGKSTSDDVLRNRIQNLFLEHLAVKTKGGRPKRNL
jgi:hypothetical protein